VRQPAAWHHSTAVVDRGARIGAGTKIWHFCHLMSGARVGPGCVLGQNVFVAGSAAVGAGCRIQNNVSIYDGVVLGDGVFVGPSAVFTNVRTPRAPVDRRADIEPTRVGEGATIGANATIVCGVTIGAHAFVGAGAVVTRDVAPHAMVSGVPARRIGWICRCGETRGSAKKIGQCGCHARERVVRQPRIDRQR
jgi:UDP-2-acetamido-3-amino-2,3-dideoxy-glucuronate N-acetyltransferase